MAYLIGQLLLPLALAAIGGGVAGWCWHCLSTRPAWALRDAERDRLRSELLSFVGVSFDRPLVTSDEHDAVKQRLAAANEQIAALQRGLEDKDQTIVARDGKVSELEMVISGLRASMPDSGAEAARIAALEEALRAAEAKASDVERRAALLEADLETATAPVAPAEDVANLHWRIHELETALAAKQAPAVSDDELNRSRWQTRYLNARVQYLEGLAATPAPAPVAEAIDEEAENRRRWRQRYLEARVAWLEGRVRDHAGLRAQHEQALGERDARIAALLEEAGRPRVDADEHENLRGRIAELETAYRELHGRATEFEAAYTTLRQQAGELQAAHNTLRTRAGELEAAYGQLQQRHAALEAEAQTLRQRVSELEGLLAASRSDAAVGARARADLEAANVRLREQIADLEARLREAPAPDPETGRLRWQSRYLDSRVRYLEQAAAAPPQATPLPAVAPRDGGFAPLAPAGDEIRPPGLPAARGGAPDDLRMIAGIGPRIESTLNSLGVFHFDQIAAWTPANVDWIERYLAFKGRIGREDWIAQARALAAGEDTAGKRQYLAGEQT